MTQFELYDIIVYYGIADKVCKYNIYSINETRQTHKI